MTSEENNGKMASPSETRSPLVEKDGEIPGDDDVVPPIGEQEEPLEGNLTEENDSEDEEATASASAENPLTSDAAQMLPLLQNLLVNNDTQRERLAGLFQLYAPTAQIDAPVNTEEDEQVTGEADISSRVHFLEQSVQRLEEEVENLKKLNAELEEQIKSLTTSSDHP